MYSGHLSRVICILIQYGAIIGALVLLVKNFPSNEMKRLHHWDLYRDVDFSVGGGRNEELNPLIRDGR